MIHDFVMQVVLAPFGMAATLTGVTCRGEEVKVENAEEQGRGGGYPGPGQQAVQAGEQQEGGEGRTPTVHVKRK